MRSFRHKKCLLSVHGPADSRSRGRHWRSFSPAVWTAKAYTIFGFSPLRRGLLLGCSECSCWSVVGEDVDRVLVRERFRVASFRAPFRLLVLNGVGVLVVAFYFSMGFSFCRNFVWILCSFSIEFFVWLGCLSLLLLGLSLKLSLYVEK